MENNEEKDPATETGAEAKETNQHTAAPEVNDTDTPEELEEVPAEGDEAPGTGIDTDGDGDAEQIVEAEPEAEPVHVDHEDDYVNKVKLSDVMQDVYSQKKAKKLVKASNINQHYKDIMLKQIKDGQLQPPYNETFKRLVRADEDGSIYRPGSDGL